MKHTTPWPHRAIGLLIIRIGVTTPFLFKVKFASFTIIVAYFIHDVRIVETSIDHDHIDFAIRSDHLPDQR